MSFTRKLQKTGSEMALKSVTRTAGSKGQCDVADVQRNGQHTLMRSGGAWPSPGLEEKLALGLVGATASCFRLRAEQVYFCACLLPPYSEKKPCQQLHMPQPSQGTVFSASEPHPVHFYFDYSTPEEQDIDVLSEKTRKAERSEAFCKPAAIIKTSSPAPSSL